MKSSGLYFHEQQFSTIRDLIAWFKEHLKEKEYQKYVKNMTAQLQKMKWLCSVKLLLKIIDSGLKIKKTLANYQFIFNYNSYILNDLRNQKNIR